MIVLQTLAAQTLAAGQSLTFARVWQTGCGECFRNNSSSVIARANGIYRVSFTGNVAGTADATQVQLSVQTAGNTEFTMIETSTLAGDVHNVAGSTDINNCCGLASTITVTNTGTNPVIVSAGALLTVAREA